MFRCTFATALLDYAPPRSAVKRSSTNCFVLHLPLSSRLHYARLSFALPFSITSAALGNQCARPAYSLGETHAQRAANSSLYCAVWQILAIECRINRLAREWVIQPELLTEVMRTGRWGASSHQPCAGPFVCNTIYIWLALRFPPRNA